jgi:transketolase
MKVRRNKKIMSERRCPYHYDLRQLQELAWHLSGQIIKMTTQAGSGHPSSSLSAIDLMTAIYFGGIMCYRPDEPEWPDRDRFILSKGHAAPALYAVLAEAGYFDPQALASLRELGSPLEGHPNMRALPGVEASTGSLGQGLSIGIGHALAAKLNGSDFRVYVMVGDGEMDEGQIWEGVMLAPKLNLDNLTVILDHNKYQQTGSINEVMPTLLPFLDKWQSFGWEVSEVEGHYMERILDSLQTVQTVTELPQFIVAHTSKGRGLSPFIEDPVNHKHGKALKPEAMEKALAELDDRKYDVIYSASDFTPELTADGKHG